MRIEILFCIDKKSEYTMVIWTVNSLAHTTARTQFLILKCVSPFGELIYVLAHFYFERTSIFSIVFSRFNIQGVFKIQ